MSAFKEAEGGLGGITAAALTVGTLAAGAVVGFAAESVHHMEETGQAAYEMSEKFGLLPGKASQWLAAGSLVGVGNEQMSTGFKFLAKNMESLNLADNATAMQGLARQHELAAKAIAKATVEMSSSNPKVREQAAATLANAKAAEADAVAKLNQAAASRPLAQAFEALGVTTKDSKGNLRDLNEVMLDAADAFSKMPDGAEKAGLAVKLFGRSGTDLIPVLNQGRQGLLDMMDASVKSGAALSGDQVEAAHKAFLAHKEFDAAISGVANQLGANLLPTVTSVVQWLTSTGIPEARKFFSDLTKNSAGIVATFKAHWPQIQATVQQFWAWIQAYVVPVVVAWVALMQTELAALLEFWKEHHNEIMAVVKPVWDFIVAVVQGALTLIKDIMKLVTDLIKGDWHALWDDVGRLVVDAVEGVTSVMRHLQEAIGAIAIGIGQAVIGAFVWWTDAVHGLVTDLDKRIYAAAGNIGSSLVNGIAQGLKDAWWHVTDIIKTLAQALPGPLKDALGIHSPSQVFAEQVGLPIAQGIAAGITGGAGTVSDALGAVVPTSLSAAGPRGGGSAGGGGGSSSEGLEVLRRILATLRDAAGGTGAGAPDSSLLQRMTDALESLDRKADGTDSGGISMGALAAQMRAG